MTSQTDMSAMIARIADRHDVPLAVLLATMASLVKSGVRPNLARLEQLLGRKAREVVALRRRLSPPSQDPVVDEARRKASRALEAGQFAEIERALAQLELHFFGGMTDLSTMPADRRVAAGETRSDRAATALLDLTPAACKEAAQRYAEAAAIIGTANLDRSREFALRQGDSLARIGEDFADPAGFEAAIAHFRTLLSRLDNFDDTIAWATVQERLARALAGLAQLTGDDKRLDEAIAYYIENYGKLLVYTFPKQKLVFGPAQVEARISQDTYISQWITLRNQHGSQVIRGDLLVIPIKDAILYVEPIFLQSTQTQLPELKQVVVAFGKRLTMKENLRLALQEVFDISDDRVAHALFSERLAGEKLPPSTRPVARTPDLPASLTDGPILDGARSLLERAQQHYRTGKEKVSKGDWAGYGAEQEKLKRALDELAELLERKLSPPARRK